MEISQQQGAFKELTLIFDNCCGQNKNRMVIRLLFFIVKLGIANKARASFLIKGHTKNDCDRLFNTMKKQYRKSNIYIPDDLMASLEQPKVHPVLCKPEFFFDWDALEEMWMSRPSKIKSYHVFTFDKNIGGGDVLISQATIEAEPKKKTIIKKDARGKDKEWWTMWVSGMLSVSPPGLQDIKWQEMYDKWGPLIPEDKKKEWKYYCTDVPTEIRDKIKANKQASKKARSGRTRTTTVA